ncbi:MFS transporter [Burkholderia ubonensis]|uniref:MFS transporter n=1 Tax=Burkholderia ubonensis TaxID=101571 RepID=A0A107FE82_9BURK|nr:MFS transporter [Burkholderia ubonensis]AOK63418.1 MFS transporter [Burkholderia ubonensis]KVS43625.1 MFS transporter [Burkholderia ubonensis]KVS45100.1 MFS transporter [Burkholderia ubonensis]KVS74503.1 MFS transporter [Burkholderia ubonensis]KVS82142.1 MFS transporter [Burkholderia ubonensis]
MSTPTNLDAAARAPLAPPHAATAAAPLDGRLVLLLAAAAGLAVAPLYYSQPMLGVLGPDLGASERAVGLVPTLTQLGYALGILLLAPLGDRFDRRRVIVTKAAALVGALLLAAAAPSIGLLLAASFAIGLSATMAQDVVPAAATLAHDAHRGRTVGTVMTGLLMGILLSRVVSGFVAENLGWRAMFVIAAASVAAIGVVAARGLPRFEPTTRLSYRALMGSLGELWRRHPALRRAALAQGLLSVGFSAFWSTLAVMLHGAPFHLGSAAAGAFGLAGAAGALAAPVAGRLADRHGPERITRLGIGIATLSFAVMALAPLLSAHAQLALLAAGTIGFDLGVQATLIAHQSIVYRIDPASRSRLNAVLFVGMFIGMAAGAAIGSQLLAQFGWTAVLALAVAASLAALATRIWRR